ncbi:MAG: methionyl-tRNA formyltransferase [Gammaproteobacteria bacterium]|nr:methionyl-tRNA formyltransferase [Gammaproteobacteria bacterium]
MEIVFAGTPEFAAVILDGLIDNGYRPRLVLTQPDRVQGRGRKLNASAVKGVASKHGIAVFQPETLSMKKDSGRAAVAHVLESSVDTFIVAAYGLMIPEPLLKSPTYGAINVHASLLPRWRGAAPVEYSIMAGDRETGISIMQMDKGLDTGPVLATASTPIDPQETGATLTDRLAHIGSALLCNCLSRLHQLSARPQDESQATAAPKLNPSTAVIDWKKPAAEIHNQVRALAGRSTAWSTLLGGDQKVLIKIHAGEVLPEEPQREELQREEPQSMELKEVRSVSEARPGAIVRHDRQDLIVVQTSRGLYGIRLLQLALGKGTIQPASAARNGFAFLSDRSGAAFELIHG